jgi:SAM-dependent methyltransferase
MTVDEYLYAVVPEPEQRITYRDRLRLTVSAMEAYLPDGPIDVLDIGCGMAGIALSLANRQGNGTRLHLLDGDVYVRELDNVRPAGYSPYSLGCKPWNDARVPAAALQAAGYDATAYPNDPMLTIPSDVIVSTRSWGHHYPVSIYLDLALRSLKPGGRMFLDVRRKTDGLDVLKQHFDVLAAKDLSGRGKCLFTICRRKGEG